MSAGTPKLYKQLGERVEFRSFEVIQSYKTQMLVKNLIATNIVGSHFDVLTDFVLFFR